MARPNPNAPLGQGGRFAAVEASAARSGAKNPAAVAAAAGMKKYGKRKMAQMAAAGRRQGDPMLPTNMGAQATMPPMMQTTSRTTRKSRMRTKKGPATTTAFMGGDKFRSY